MFDKRTSVGLDVHARSVSGAAIDSVTGEVFRRELGADPVEVLSWLAGLPGPVAAVYEAGPTGYGLCRALREAEVSCEVVAPSKVLRPAGDRVKTDRRDALLLARLLLVGDVPAVAVPTPGQEAARDLVRAREAARGDLMSARHRLGKLLLRHGLVYPGPSRAWTTLAHGRWLTGCRDLLDGGPLLAAFDEARDAVLTAQARRDRLDAEVADLAADSEWTALVRRLSCLRGVSDLTALGLAVEVGDWSRLDGSSIGAFAGLVPSEHSSGARRRQGSITKAGNSHVRWLLVEAAWHHRRSYHTPSKALRKRWDAATPQARARGHAGNLRLHRRWRAFDARQKRPSVANAAVARELAGWCWSLAVMDDPDG